MKYLTVPKPFKNQIFFSSLLFFDGDRRPMMFTICGSQKFFRPDKVTCKRAPDLLEFNTYSLFGPLCFVSFLQVLFTSKSAYISAQSSTAEITEI